jgi:hypothetical protein
MFERLKFNSVSNRDSTGSEYDRPLANSLYTEANSD